MKAFTIKENDAGQRLDKFIFKAVPRMPKSQVFRSLRLKRIKRNKKRCQCGDILEAGDLIELYVNDDYFTQAEYPFLDAPPVISVVFEDENILLVDKAPGLVVHEDNDGEKDTLIHRIQHYLYTKGEYDPAKENSFAPALCNRIDRNTGGIVIAAKNFESLQILSDKIKSREITKKYLCLVHGVPERAEGVIRNYLRKNAQTNMVEVLDKMESGAKTAITKYSLIKTNGTISLVEAELLTGRTHQIRAHMASIGHPLVGDTKYGTNKINRDTGHRFQALYSYMVSFDFTTGAGRLDYLRGKSFSVGLVPFEREV